MKQSWFEERGEAFWRGHDELLGALERGGKHPRSASLPQEHAQICSMLALARERRYTLGLIDRLEELALRGQRVLYAGRADPEPPFRGLMQRFPRAVREHWALHVLAATLFYGPWIFGMILVANRPELATMVVDPSTLIQMEQMYDPSGEVQAGERTLSDDVAMFGYYIWNNVGIALRTFGAGAALGVGSGLILVYNGLVIGAVSGHLTAVGLGGSFWPFVIGHGSFELTAIVIAGAAGLKLGWGLVAPGRLGRAAALRAGAREALPLILGAGGMLFIAAGIEAFWSPSRVIPDEVKLAVGATLWLGVLGYLILGGRTRHAR
ncbi:stage II sporulation protein M [Myxococcota bacterium]|nr:stage II sporulation protein M [Myxococcota bacterium]